MLREDRRGVPVRAHGGARIFLPSLAILLQQERGVHHRSMSAPRNVERDDGYPQPGHHGQPQHCVRRY